MQELIEKDQAIRQLAQYFKNTGIPVQATVSNELDLVDFAHKYFYIPGDLKNPANPIRLLPHQVAILNFMFNTPEEYLPEIGYYQTLIYSTIKKSGKSSIAALVARWATETWARFGETYCVANDFEQARGKIYHMILESIMLDPRFNTIRREIPGEWRIIDRVATHIPTGSTIKAIANDYKGESGGNQTLTLWDELWGATSEASRRLWDEMTPVPTRDRSCRFISTYAGFSDESDLLIELYNQGIKDGERVDIPGWPFDDPSPIYINRQTGLCMYWDTGVLARRMPWQVPVYYTQQAAQLRPDAYDRLHGNLWTSSLSSLLPIEWWDACYEEKLPVLNNTTPCVIGVDASVSNDCTVCVLITRHPKIERGCAIRAGRCWKPTNTNTMNYSAEGGLKETLIDWCKRFNVVEITYDAYQLHGLMTDLRLDGVAWCKPFSQGGDRNKADKQLYDLIRDKQIAHYGDAEMRQHILNAASKSSRDEDTKFRIVKRNIRDKIDYSVAMGMGCFECLRLLID